MAQTGFQIQCWGRQSASGNEVIQTSQTGNLISGCFRKYSYYSPVDTQATCAASGYFNTVAFDLITGDYIEIYSAAEGTLVNYRVTNSQGLDPSTTSTATITLSSVTGVITASGTISNAQILAGLYAHPVQIVPAPAATQMIVAVNATFSLIWGSVQFQNGGATLFQYDSTVHGAGTNSLATALTAANINGATANNYQTFVGVAQAWGTQAAVIGKGIFLSCATGEFTAGDSTFEYTYNYRLVSLV